MLVHNGLQCLVWPRVWRLHVYVMVFWDSRLPAIDTQDPRVIFEPMFAGCNSPNSSWQVDTARGQSTQLVQALASLAPSPCMHLNSIVQNRFHATAHARAGFGCTTMFIAMAASVSATRAPVGWLWHTDFVQDPFDLCFPSGRKCTNAMTYRIHSSLLIVVPCKR